MCPSYIVFSSHYKQQSYAYQPLRLTLIHLYSTIEQSLQYLRNEIEALGIHIPDYDPSESDYKSQGGQYLLEKMGNEVTSMASSVRELSDHSSALKKTYICNLEYYYLMVAGQNIVHKRVVFSPDTANTLRSGLDNIGKKPAMELRDLSRGGTSKSTSTSTAVDKRLVTKHPSLMTRVPRFDNSSSASDSSPDLEGGEISDGSLIYNDQHMSQHENMRSMTFSNVRYVQMHVKMLMAFALYRH